VAETNIHYPTESALIGDGLRKVVALAAELAAAQGLDGWRQHKHLVKKVRRLVRAIGRQARTKEPQRTERLKSSYAQLLALAQDLLTRAGQLLALLGWPADPQVFSLEALKNAVPPTQPEALVLHYMALTEQVCATARRRVLHGETVANEEKLFSIFEPHTELIKRGKQPVAIEYGHKVLIIEDAAGFVIDYRVLENGVLDQDVVVPVMKALQKRFGGRIKSASFDRGFHTPENQQALADLVQTPCLAAKGEDKARQQEEEGGVAFRQARQHHPGVESAIGALQAGNGLKRCRDRSRRGYERYVGLGILGRNLQTLGKRLLAADDATAAAAQTKRKRVAG
jgi:hypothetical protein